MNNRIKVVAEDKDNGVQIVIAYVDGKEVTSFSNDISNTWGCGSSSALPYDFVLTSLYIEAMFEAQSYVKDCLSFQRGVRVLVNNDAGFNRGAKGVVKFVEPSGEKIWVLRDGSNSPVFYLKSELDIIG